VAGAVGGTGKEGQGMGVHMAVQLGGTEGWLWGIGEKKQEKSVEKGRIRVEG